MAQLDRSASTTSSSSRSLRGWVGTMVWGLIYTSLAIVSSGLGFAAMLFLPNPFAAPLTSSATTNESFTRVAQGMIPYKLSRPINVLVMGIDRVEGTEPGSLESFSGRSDSLLLLHLNPDSNTVNILSIPRDTRVELPNYGFTKINHANWFGGPKLLQSVIATNFNDLTVDRYLRVDTGIFREIIDTIGGVEVLVPKAMKYTDQTQGLYIDLEAGLQTLNGDQAEQFARFRHDEYGDIGRVQRQQLLLQALRKRIGQPSTLAKLPQLLTLVEEYVDTNLTREELLALVGFGLKLETDQFNLVMLPGRASYPGEFLASYWLPDVEAQNQILVEQFEQPSLFADANVNVVSDLSERQPRIAVQNASGYPDQASKMADYLAQLGFRDVYIVEDWPTELNQTAIIAQRGNRKTAESLQTQLTVGQVEVNSTGAIESDLTLRLGLDSAVFLEKQSQE